jgi:hypothetical protein
MSGILQLPPVIEVTTLRTAFPTYKFNVITEGDRRRYECISRSGDDPIYCLISVSAREIWIELAGANGVAVPRNG